MQSHISKLLGAVLLGLLGLAVCAQAQTRGGGGFSGFGGASRSSTASTAGSAARQYPNNATIGDAYFSIDPETRRVVFIADEETARYIGQVLTNLDRPKPQVLIKVVFLEVNRDDASDIGVEGYYSKNLGNSWNSGLVTNYGVTSSNTIVPTGITPGRSSSMFGGTNFFGLPSPASFSGANGIYQILGQDFMVTLHAIAQAGKAKVLSRPSILARNNQPAVITVGQSVPLITNVRYDNFGNAINSVSYQDVGVILRVTPFITGDGMVEMIVSPEISRIDPTTSIPISATANGTTISAPVIDVRSADTVAVTPDGQPVVIGGLMQTTKAETTTKIPLLGDIPLLGNLFQRKQKSDSKSELMIFLTPHIVAQPSELAALSAKQRERSDAYKGLTEEELNKFLDEIPKKKSTPDAGSKSAPMTPPKGS